MILWSLLRLRRCLNYSQRSRTTTNKSRINSVDNESTIVQPSSTILALLPSPWSSHLNLVTSFCMYDVMCDMIRRVQSSVLQARIVYIVPSAAKGRGWLEAVNVEWSWLKGDILVNWATKQSSVVWKWKWLKLCSTYLRRKCRYLNWAVQRSTCHRREGGGHWERVTCGGWG